MNNLLLALVAACGLTFFSSGASAWQTNISGTELGSSWFNAVALDGAGNVVAAGQTNNVGTAYDFTVVKFDGASGVELWRQVIDGTANGDDSAAAVAVDAVGDVVTAGNTQNIAPPMTSPWSSSAGRTETIFECAMRGNLA